MVWLMYCSRVTALLEYIISSVSWWIGFVKNYLIGATSQKMAKVA